MKYLRILWIRILVSLFGGGLVTEIFHISTGDPNRPMTVKFSLIYAIVIYLALTFM